MVWRSALPSEQTREKEGEEEKSTRPVRVCAVLPLIYIFSTDIKDGNEKLLESQTTRANRKKTNQSLVCFTTLLTSHEHILWHYVQ